MSALPSSHYTVSAIEVGIDDLILTRFPSASSLRINAETVADLLFDAIEVFAIRTGIRTTRYADAYPLAVAMTIGTFAKPHLSGICRFEQLPVEAALRWVKSRLLSNLKTVLTNPKSKYWLGHADREQAAAEYVTFGNAETEAELDGVSREQAITGLRALFIQGADIGELEYLADRFEITLKEVIGSYTGPVIVERTPQGNPQLCMDLGV